MDFQHEDRCYFNRWMYEDKSLHLSSSEERFLEYFLMMMRDYGLLTQYSKSNYVIKTSILE